MGEIRASILRLGGKKFGVVPEGVGTVVKAISDRARLERMLDRILVATGWVSPIATA